MEAESLISCKVYERYGKIEMHQISGSTSLTNGKPKQHKTAVSPDRSNTRAKTPHLPKINTRYDRGTSAFLCVGRDGSKPSLVSSYARSKSAVNSAKIKGHAHDNDKTDFDWTTSVSETEAPQSCTLQIRKSPDVLPPISPTSPQHSGNVEKDILEGDSATTDDNDVVHALPPTSSIFQQALSDLRNRRSSDEDPGDLMVRRSSLTSALINMGAIKTHPSFLEPGKRSDIIQEDVIAEVVDEHIEPLQPLILGDEALKSKRLRANWKRAKAKVNCNRINKAHKPSHEKDVSREIGEKDGKNSPEILVSPPMKFLLKKNKSNTGSSSAVFEDQHDMYSLSSTSGGECPQSRPMTKWRKTTGAISLKTVGQITRLMSIAGASSCAPGVSSKSTNLLSKPEEGRLMHRERRESLRLIKQTLDAIRQNEDDLTEVCGFDELRNCRYLRTRHMSERRRSSLLGFNEI